MEYILEEERPLGHLIIVLGYVLALTGGLLGLLVGNHILTSYVVVKGERVYKYDSYSRRHGRMITILSIAVILVSLCLRIVVKL